MYSPSVMLVSPTNETANPLLELAQTIGFESTQIDSVIELVPVLSNPTTHVDLVIFDLPTLYTTDSASIFEIINMISTLCRFNATPTILAVMVEADGDPIIIKSIQGTDIRGIVPKGSWLGAGSEEFAIRELLAGRTYMPKKAWEKTTTKKANTKSKRDSGVKLTNRQEQILKLICNRGASNKAIAKLLNISESTVKLHVSAVLKKFGVRNRTQLALFADASLK